MCKLRFQTHVSESRWWFGDAFRLKQSYVHAAFICLGSLTAKADFVTLYQTRKSRAGSLHRYPRFQNNTTWPPRFEKVGSQCSLQTWTRASEHRANAHPELKAHRSDKHPIQSPPHPLQKTTPQMCVWSHFCFPFPRKTTWTTSRVCSAVFAHSYHTHLPCQRRSKCAGRAQDKRLVQLWSSAALLFSSPLGLCHPLRLRQRGHRQQRRDLTVSNGAKEKLFFYGFGFTPGEESIFVFAI